MLVALLTVLGCTCRYVKIQVVKSGIKQQLSAKKTFLNPLRLVGGFSLCNTSGERSDVIAL
jgi:hypothetical protein